MNLARAIRRSRHELARSSVAIFGQTASGSLTWGTGVLLDFRGTPCALTCAHVLDPIVDIAYVTSGRYSYQAEGIEVRRFTDAKLDSACLVLRDARRFAEKRFISAADAWCGDVGLDELAVAYGFPKGNPYLQRGATFDASLATARFRSMTYFTMTTIGMTNSRLGRRQPRLDWNYGNNQDAKRFERLPMDLTPKERGGFSGGPVVLGWFDSWRLAGQVTDATEQSLFYNRIGDVLAWLDKSL